MTIIIHKTQRHDDFITLLVSHLAIASLHQDYCLHSVAIDLETLQKRKTPQKMQPFQITKSIFLILSFPFACSDFLLPFQIIMSGFLHMRDLFSRVD